jgi:hypothetical protein
MDVGLQPSQHFGSDFRSAPELPREVSTSVNHALLTVTSRPSRRLERARLRPLGRAGQGRAGQLWQSRHVRIRLVTRAMFAPQDQA